MDYVNHWIPRPSFQTRLYHPALAGTPPEEGNWNHLDGLFMDRMSCMRREGRMPVAAPTPLYHLGGLFQTPLYHLHPCRRASMQAGLRRNDGKGGFQLPPE